MRNQTRLDSLDKRILTLLSANARLAYLEVARICGVSGAAIHQRVQKMMDDGLIVSSGLYLDHRKLGYNTCAFVGIRINLTSATTHEEVFRKIKQIPEIVECHHVTGKYSLLVKIFTKSNEHLKSLLVEKIQSIVEITSTETFISLEEGFTRTIKVED